MADYISNTEYTAAWLTDIQTDTGYELYDLEQMIIENDLEILEAAMNDPDGLKRSLRRNREEILTLSSMSNKEFGEIHALRLWTLMVHNDFLQSITGTRHAN